METVKFILIQFVIAFVLVYLVEYIILVRKNKEYNKEKVPTEVEYIVKVYKVNITKIDYYSLIKTLALTNTLIIVSVFTIVSNIIIGTLWQLLIGFALLCILILLSYKLVGQHYKEVSDKNV